MIRFLRAPHLPDGMDEAVWQREWIGLEVSSRPALCNVGFLGNLNTSIIRVWDEERHMFVSPTQIDAMNHISTHDSFRSMLMVRGQALRYVCEHKSPLRPYILRWLDEPAQADKEEFLVPRAMVEVVLE